MFHPISENEFLVNLRWRNKAFHLNFNLTFLCRFLESAVMRHLLKHTNINTHKIQGLELPVIEIETDLITPLSYWLLWLTTMQHFMFENIYWKFVFSDKDISFRVLTVAWRRQVLWLFMLYDSNSRGRLRLIWCTTLYLDLGGTEQIHKNIDLKKVLHIEGKTCVVKIATYSRELVSQMHFSFVVALTRYLLQVTIRYDVVMS